MCLLKGRDMGLDPLIVADEIVVNGTVFAVSYHGVNAPLGIVLMDCNHLPKHLTIISRSRGNFSGSDDLAVGV